jgi:hypothetical protein
LVDALAQLSFLVSNALAEIAGQHDLSIILTRLLGVLRDREPTMNALGRLLGPAAPAFTTQARYEPRRLAAGTRGRHGPSGSPRAHGFPPSRRALPPGQPPPPRASG